MVVAPFEVRLPFFDEVSHLDTLLPDPQASAGGATYPSACFAQAPR